MVDKEKFLLLQEHLAVIMQVADVETQLLQENPQEHLVKVREQTLVAEVEQELQDSLE